MIHLNYDALFLKEITYYGSCGGEWCIFKLSTECGLFCLV